MDGGFLPPMFSVRLVLKKTKLFVSYFTECFCAHASRTNGMCASPLVRVFFLCLQYNLYFNLSLVFC